MNVNSLHPWKWPICAKDYDMVSDITETEYMALKSLGWQVRQPNSHDLNCPEWLAIQRLFQPLNDARQKLYVPDTHRHYRFSCDAVALILQRCVITKQAYWYWSNDTWLNTFGPDFKQFKECFPDWVDGTMRPYMYGIAYLLNYFQDIHLLHKNNNITLATRVFGPDLVQKAITPVVSTMGEWGYKSAHRDNSVAGLVCILLLYNRNPYLQSITSALIDRVRSIELIPSPIRSQLYGVHKALTALGYINEPLNYPSPQFHAIQGVDPQWVYWVDRWAKTSTLANHVRRANRCILLKIGRWLSSEYPEIQEPSQWTRQVCAASIAMIQQLNTGDYVQRKSVLAKRLGTPLSPRTKATHITILRTFFQDCQEWEWIPRRFNPIHAFAIPKTISTLLGPNPRVIADDIWAKLLWAGLNLTQEDLPSIDGGYYPLEFLKALALVWLFGGLRSDEIVRLRVGCIRWGPPTEAHAKQTICNLDVPPNKTGSAFTKPIDPVVGQAIATWESIRPEQPMAIDRKTGESVHFLFSCRARRVARVYINEGLIPILCRKAGVPTNDVRGPITSHRARATIATQLYNAKEPMSLPELQAWLGHSSPETTRYYAQVTPTKLAKAYSDTAYFARNMRTIEVLIDRDAITSGRVTDGAPWQYFDLGHGFCTYTFFEQCPHRMACARCDFYVPKDSTNGQLLEAKENLQRMLATIPLTDEERAVVEDDTTAFDRLLERLANVPTPTGKTPHQLSTREIIPLRIVENNDD